MISAPPLSLISLAVLAFSLRQAWKTGNRRGQVDLSLILLSMAALLIPERYPLLRYGIAGPAMAAVLARSVKFDLAKGADKFSRAMTIGLLLFVVTAIPVLSMRSPVPVWTKYLATFGAVGMMAAFLWQWLWMTRLLFSANRLRRDLKHKRPPREADERTLGIDLSMLRK